MTSCRLPCGREESPLIVIRARPMAGSHCGAYDCPQWGEVSGRWWPLVKAALARGPGHRVLGHGLPVRDESGRGIGDRGPEDVRIAKRGRAVLLRGGLGNRCARPA